MNLETLKSYATTQMKQFPQYAGHFDGYVLARMKRDVTTKGGASFVAGELVIAKRPAVHAFGRAGDFVTAWSQRRSIDVSVCRGDILFLDEPATISAR